jgi:hypothetical protein
VRLRPAAAVALSVTTLLVNAQPAAALAPPPPRGNVAPTLDAVPAGTVGVAAASAPVDGTVAILVQNAGTQPVRSVRVAATATPPDGASATASTADIVPSTLVPGALGLGLLRFRAGDVRGNPTLGFRVKTSRSKSDDAPDALDVRDITATAPLTGNIAQRLNLAVFNPGTRTVRGPVRVRVVCFGESARPTQGVDRVRGVRRVTAGAEVDARIELRDLCPTYLVAARGLRRR